MGLPQILTDKEMLNTYIQEAREIGEKARIEGKVYKICTEDNHLDEYVESICIYAQYVNIIIRNILYGVWWKGYRNE